MLKERIYTSFTGIALLLLLLWLGNPWFIFLVGLAAIIAAWEFYKLIFPGDRKTVLRLGLALAFLLAAGPVIKEKSLYIALFIAIAFPFLWICIKQSIKQRSFTSREWDFFLIVILSGLFLSYYTYLINISEGRSWTFLALFTTFAADSGAFFIGRTLGKIPLAPKISPRKTWEGAIGGFICAVLSGMIISYFLFKLTDNFLLSLMPGVLIGIFSPMGDLAVSMLKRRAGVKDSGTLLPGHGGLLDRIDSLLVSGIVIYFYAILI